MAGQQITPSGQLALDIFTELRMTEMPIAQAPQDIGFNRNNIFLDITDVGLTGRKALDAAYFLVATSADMDTYDFDLGYFRWLMGYESNNRQHLRSALREAQKAAIQVNDIDHDSPERDRWVSVPLLGAVGMAGGRISIQVPEALRKQLRDPRSYTYLSMRIKARFSTVYAMLLYERLSSVAYRGGTDWETVDTVKEWLQCTNARTLNEFKYLKSRVLDPSIDQVNSVSDINVRMETRTAPGTKRISQLRFIVRTDIKNACLPAPDSQFASEQTYIALRDEFGLSQTELDEIGSNRDKWDNAWIEKAIEFTRRRIEQGKVKIPHMFLMKALREGLQVSSSERKVMGLSEAESRKKDDEAARKTQKAQERRIEEEQKSREVSEAIMEALRRFDGMKPEEREGIVARFARSTVGKAAAAKNRLKQADIKEEVIRASESMSKMFGGYLVSQKA